MEVICCLQHSVLWHQLPGLAGLCGPGTLHKPWNWWWECLQRPHLKPKVWACFGMDGQLFVQQGSFYYDKVLGFSKEDVEDVLSRAFTLQNPQLFNVSSGLSANEWGNSLLFSQSQSCISLPWEEEALHILTFCERGEGCCLHSGWVSWGYSWLLHWLVLINDGRSSRTDEGMAFNSILLQR